MLSRDSYVRKLFTGTDEAILQIVVQCGRQRFCGFEVIEVSSRDLTGRVVTCRKPYLCTMCLVEIITGVGPAHLRLHPAGCHRITTYTGQPAGHGKRKENVVELRV